MFGTNPVRKQELHNDTFWVQEIFPTIQGESIFAGVPAIFIRLAGCNLRCWFCDTDFESSTMHLTAEQIVEHVELMREMTIDTDLVVLTGGEPMRQNIAPLVRLLSDKRFLVQIETAGTLWVPDMPDETIYVCSPKTGKLNPEIVRRCNDYKYIVRDGGQSEDDGLPIMSTQLKDEHCIIARPPDRQGIRVWVQPMDEADETKNAKNTVACLNACFQYGYRFSFQIHKAIGIR